MTNSKRPLTDGDHPVTEGLSPEEVVLAFISALNDEDFGAARSRVTDDLTFVGVMGSRHGAEACFRDMEHLRLKYVVRKVFVDEDDICLFYDIDMSGKSVFASGWYHVEAGRISGFKVVFDPRPLLEASDKG